MPLLVLRLVEVPAYRKYLPLPGVWAARLRAAAASASAPLSGADEILICRYDTPRRVDVGTPGRRPPTSAVACGSRLRHGQAGTRSVPLRAPFGLEVFGGVEIAGQRVPVQFAGERELQVVAGGIVRN